MRASALEPNDLLLFARVADLGSFSRAAERLGVPKSTVSRRVSALESQLGERLLQRTTRKLTLTELGQAVLEHARHVVEDVEAASSLAANRQLQPSGRLRVTMPGDFGNLVMSPMLAAFALKHPAIRLDIDLSARFVDLIGEGFDLAIRMGDLRDDASLAARRVAVFTNGLYASPAYLKRRGKPAEPEALMEHDALHVTSRTGEPMPWTLHRGKQQWHGVPPTRAMANSPELLMRLALKGAGIAAVNDHFALAHVKRKELLCVLPEWRPAPVSAWAVFPGRRLMPAKTRVFLDALAAVLGGPECQAVRTEVDNARAARRAA
ncbi:MAG TPA: LysR substrate-binding domain-containing protein [Usitatibacter sp.]|nr:LysR substrate-binding domain-containing protein [Usitatibacter sp.]